MKHGLRMMDAQSFDTQISLARVLIGNRLTNSIMRSIGSRSEFVPRSSEIFVFFRFVTLSEADDVVSAIPLLSLLLDEDRVL